MVRPVPPRTGRSARPAARIAHGVAATLCVLSLLCPPASASTVFTVAGRRERFAFGGYGGDGRPATEARLGGPGGLAVLPDGGYVIAEYANNRIRRVLPDGLITTVAGNGRRGFTGDGGPATSARLNTPTGVAAVPGGGFLIADSGNQRIRAVAPNGTISTVAGSGPPGRRKGGFSGDGGPATAARLNDPVRVAAGEGGTFLVADADNHRVRKVTSDGTIRTVAGSGPTGEGGGGFAGDGGPADRARLDGPSDVVQIPGGGFLIADDENDRVRAVDASGNIRTVAGGGRASAGRGSLGDRGPSTAARLDDPVGLAMAPGGAFLIADAGHARIRRVGADGIISTVAGSTPVSRRPRGDGGSARCARLGFPGALAWTPDGGFLIADPINSNVRFVAPRETYRLAVAMSRPRRPHGHPRLSVVLSTSALLDLRVLRGRCMVLRYRIAAKPGRRHIRVARALRPGRYLASVTASTPDGRVATARTTFVIGRGVRGSPSS